MALEIERRFLVRGDGWRACVVECRYLQQGYLVASPDGLTVRVRRSEDPAAPAGVTPASAWLTLKAPPPEAATPPLPDGLVRQEFEYPIPDADARALLALAPRQLRKSRHVLRLGGGDWVVDVFEAGNAPLVVAEVELGTPDQPLVVPPWCVLEVTGRHELSNAALAREPLEHWGAERRATLPAWLWTGRNPVTSDTVVGLS